MADEPTTESQTDNPYAPPKAFVEQVEQAPEPVVIPPKVLSRIKNGWVAGLISISLTTIFTLVAIFSTAGIPGLSVWSFIDVVIGGGLTFGVYKKSRVCAVLLLLFFVLNKIIAIQSGGVAGLPMALVFLWFFANGVVGTFEFHELKKSKP